MQAERWDVIIIGAGIAGLSTAIWARRLDLSALVLDQATAPGGNLQALHYQITDYPGLPPMTGAELAQRLAEQASAAGAILRLETPVLSVDGSRLLCETPGTALTARAVVLATGLSPRRLGVPGEAELYKQGLVRRPSVDPRWFAGKRVAIIGGGDRAAENALLVAGVASQTWLIHRSEQLRARRSLSDQLQKAPGVEQLLGAHVSAIAARGGTATLQLTLPGEVARRLTVDAVCIYIGNQPNVALVEGQVAQGADGYLVVDANGQTSVPGLYAVGDICTPPEYQSLVTGAAQGMVAAKHIALNRLS